MKPKNVLIVINDKPALHNYDWLSHKTEKSGSTRNSYFSHLPKSRAKTNDYEFLSRTAVYNAI